MATVRGAAHINVWMPSAGRCNRNESTEWWRPIKAFFDTVNHAWLMKFLKHRIGDERVLRLIVRMLRVILEDGLVHATDQGTPQGSILSPLLSNIYLHYVLDVWFSRGCAGNVKAKRTTSDLLMTSLPASSTKAKQRVFATSWKTASKDSA